MKTTKELTPIWRTLVGGTSLVLCFLATNPLQGQTGNDEDDIFDLDPFAVESPEDFGYRKTVAVTATRLGLPIIETPLNISVVSRELLDDLSTRTTNQMFYYTSGIRTTFDSPSNLLGIGTSDGGVTIRGFRTSFIYQDGFRRLNGFHIDGIDRSEVVKGPVGLFFGRTDPGGIINFISKKPMFIDSTDVTTSIGNDNFYKAMLDHQKVLVDEKLAYRFVTSYRDSDDWMEDTHWEETYAYGVLSWTPTTNMRIDAQFEHFNQNRDGGRVGLLVANQRYLDAAANGELILGSDGLYERRDEWVKRLFNETGESTRAFTGFYIPPGKGHNFNRNGPGSFDDNKVNTGVIDFKWRPTENLNIRSAFSHTETDSDVSWFIAQDPHQNPAPRPYHLWALGAALVNDGDPNCFNCVNYGMFQAPIFSRDGGSAPGRQYLQNEYDIFQIDATYNIDALGGNHSFGVSAEYIDNRGVQKGYINDLDAFVRAGAIPAGAQGLGNDSFLNAESNQILMQKHQQLVDWGLLQPGQPFPFSVFSANYVNFDDPNAKIPNMRDWLAGRNDFINSGTDTVDKSYAFTYRAKYFEDRLLLMGGVRFNEFETMNLRNDDGAIVETGNSESWEETTSTFGANFYVTPEIVLYTSFSETFLPQAGTVNPEITNVNTGEVLGGNPLEPETGEGWEVGIKGNIQNGVWSGTISFFELERGNLTISDLPLNDRLREENEAAQAAGNDFIWVDESGSPITLDNGAGLRNNGGAQVTKGIESDIIWTPNRNFQAIFSFTHYFDAKWDPKDATQINVLNGGLWEGWNGINDGLDAIPDEMENLPDTEIAIWGKYTFTEGVLEDLSIGLGGNYQSSEVHEVRSGILPFTTDSYIRYDAMVSYETEVWNRPLTLRLTINNLLDEETFSGSFAANPTREWTLTARYSF